MAQAKDLSGLPELRGGLSLSQAALALTERLGREVTAQQVYYLVARRRQVRAYRTEVDVVKATTKAVLAVNPFDLEALATALDDEDRGG